MIREIEGTIQLKKYRAMRRRYGEGVDVVKESYRIETAINSMQKSRERRKGK